MDSKKAAKQISFQSPCGNVGEYIFVFFPVFYSLCRGCPVAKSCPTLCHPIDCACQAAWPKYCSLNFSISTSGQYSGLISFRIDWFDLAVLGILKSLLQHHNLKASILWLSVFFMVQFSHLYMITNKTITFIMWTFVRKVMSLPLLLSFAFAV